VIFDSNFIANHTTLVLMSEGTKPKKSNSKYATIMIIAVIVAFGIITLLLSQSGYQCEREFVTISGTDGDDTIYGTSGDDVIHGKDGNDTIYGGAGDDIICGGAGDDHIFGGKGNDIINGQSGSDVLEGQEGDDKLNGANIGFFEEDGTNTLNGGPGHDVCYGTEFKYKNIDCEVN